MTKKTDFSSRKNPGGKKVKKKTKEASEMQE
jgi:hypothetical protein